MQDFVHQQDDCRVLSREPQGLKGRNIFKGYTQRAQYPLIKEYSLNQNMNPLIL